MTLKIDEEVQSEILSACRAGELLHDLSKYRWHQHGSGNDVAVAAAADIHNRGDFNLLAEFSNAHLKKLTTHRFFTVQLFFTELLPNINGTVEDVSQCVKDMVECGGRDLVANDPNVAFRAWCKKDAQRPEGALRIALANPNKDTGVLAFALEAGAEFDRKKYVTKAIELSSLPQAHIKLHCITAMGRIDCSDERELQTKVTTRISKIIEDTDDGVELANATLCLLEIYARDENLAAGEIEPALTIAVAKSGDETQNALATALWNYHDNLTPSLRDLFLSALEEIDPKNQGTLDRLDLALLHMLDVGNRETVANHLHKMITNPSKGVQLRQFNSLADALRGKQRSFLNWLLVRWLRYGENLACGEVASLLTEVGREATPINDVDFSTMALSESDLMLISRRALGFLNLAPVAAASILVGAIRASDGTSKSKLCELLFDPLLINYLGAAEIYLQTIANDTSDCASETVQEALKKREHYISGLRSIGDLPELIPSNQNRRVAAEKQKETQSRANKTAEKSSILSSIVSRSVILYGNSTVTYIDRERSGTLSRSIMKMNKFEISVEIPRMEIIDPVGSMYRRLLLRRRPEQP